MERSISKQKYQKIKISQRNLIYIRNQSLQEAQDQSFYKKYKVLLFIGILVLIFIIVRAYANAIFSIKEIKYQATSIIDDIISLDHPPKLGNTRFKSPHQPRKIYQDEENSLKKTASNSSILYSQYIQKFKKMSPQISMDKLSRAKQLLKNFTGPIDNKYYTQQKQSYEKNYQISKYKQKPICIVVPTYNNVIGQRYKKNIDSILQQDYQNYKVIVIDDASPDNTGGLLLRHLRDNSIYLSGRIKIHRNLERRKTMINVLDAGYNFCKPEDIFMIIDGDDYLLGKYVFKLFNAAYSSSDSWIVYSNFLSMQGKIGFSRRYPLQTIQRNQFRNVLLIISHLRSYYTKLLHLVQKQDFLDENGQFFQVTSDTATLMPILQMGRQHIKYLPQINYFYNSNTGHNDHQQNKQQQKKNDKFVRMKRKYRKIDQLFPKKTPKNKRDIKPVL